jgi:hypothetical protein
MSQHPRFGRTKSGLDVHAHVTDHLPRKGRAGRFNAWLAVKITAGVGTMWCAYIFCAISLAGLPQALQQSLAGGHFSALPLVQWIAQTFLQLVLLSVIIVGQNIGASAADARSARTFEDAEAIKTAVITALDRLDISTEGGLQAVLNAITTLRADMAARPKPSGELLAY